MSTEHDFPADFAPVTHVEVVQSVACIVTVIRDRALKVREEGGELVALNDFEMAAFKLASYVIGAPVPASQEIVRQ